MNEKEITYSISKNRKNCLAIIVATLLASMIFNITDSFFYPVFLAFIYYYITFVLFSGQKNKYHEQFHKKGFLFRNNSYEINAKDNYTEVNDPIPVIDYIIGLLTPIIMYFFIDLFFFTYGMFLNYFIDFNKLYGVTIYSNYILFLTILNPIVWGFLEFMLDIWVAIRLFFATLGKRKKFKVKTPGQKCYGYVLVPVKKSNETGSNNENQLH